MEPLYFVYILRSIRSGKFYKGMTIDLEKRMFQHEKGYTAGNRYLGPFKLVFVQICDSRVEARTIEKYLKSGAGREIIPEISY